MNSTLISSVTLNPQYLTVFDFEKQHDFEGWNYWTNANPFFAAYASAIFLVAVYFGQKFMLSREKLQVRGYLVAWNGFLAVLSMAMFLRMLPELVEEVKNYGMYSTFLHFKEHNIVTRLWGLVFAFSKILEFGDTFFLVVAKKPILFLHWYHHVSVASYTFLFANDPLGRWFAVVNAAIHSVMYSYYGLRSMGVKIPKNISMSVTLLQISQMIFGIYTNILTHNCHDDLIPCHRPYWASTAALLMYASYLVLFANFFYRAYLKSSFTPKKIKEA